MCTEYCIVHFLSWEFRYLSLRALFTSLPLARPSSFQGHRASKHLLANSLVTPNYLMSFTACFLWLYSTYPNLQLSRINQDCLFSVESIWPWLWFSCLDHGGSLVIQLPVPLRFWNACSCVSLDTAPWGIISLGNLPLLKPQWSPGKVPQEPSRLCFFCLSSICTYFYRV